MRTVIYLVISIESLLSVIDHVFDALFLCPSDFQGFVEGESEKGDGDERQDHGQSQDQRRQRVGAGGDFQRWFPAMIMGLDRDPSEGQVGQG